VLAESRHTTNRQIEIQTDPSQKYSVQFNLGDKDACSVRQIEYKQCRMAGFDRHYPDGDVQSSVTKFRFEDNRPVEVCDEWYYTVHYLKSVVSDIEQSLNDLGISSAADTNGLRWFARPYHYTKDDIIDIHRLQSPDERIHSTVADYDVAMSETDESMSQKYHEKSSVDVDVSADQFLSVFVSNAESNSLDKFLASTALATVCNIVPLHCSCGGLFSHGGAAELFPYLDEKTFCSGLLTGLSQTHHSLHVLHCGTASQPLVMDSFGLLYFGDRQDPRMLSAGISADLTPGGDGNKQKLPNIDQLRAIQDNLAFNVCYVLAFYLTSMQTFILDLL